MGGDLRIVSQFTSENCVFKFAVGDLTTLSKKDAVDILVVSAFPGDYATIPGTLIGALHSRLKVSLRELAKDRVDYRLFYNCWYSRLLPSHLNFRRILCFENVTKSHPSQALGDIFRCILPLFNDNQGSVAVPILASGNQGYSHKQMLSATIESAITWLQSGLSMKSLIICSYLESKELLAVFNSYKAQLTLPMKYPADSGPKVSPTKQPTKKPVTKVTPIKNVPATNSLRIVDSFGVEGTACPSIIKYATGDLTDLQKSDEIDVLVVSAFSNDYAAIPGTLIGALKKNLGISVEELAKNKAEDYRKYYSCWWSQLLPSHINFKRIVCFEKKISVKPTQVIGNIFRCFFPLFNNEPCSVAMPVLATGNQGYSQTRVFESLLNAAIRWIRAGLPLKSLLVCNFTKNPELDLLFTKIKATALLPQPIAKVPEFDFDFYISYSPQDITLANRVKNELENAWAEEKKAIRLHTNFQEINPDISWQDEIYNAICKSIRVIVILTPSYLQCEACKEQFNVALCVNQQSKWNLLAPLYVIAIPDIPTYITLVQYIDCRDNTEVCISKASEQFCEWHQRSSDELELIDNPYEKATIKYNYDLFISYCHENSNYAKLVLEKMKIFDEDANIFFDVQQLKTGTAWQKELYEAIDGSQSLVAIVTPAYVRSKVCYEEFSLALALDRERNTSEGKRFYFCPVILNSNDDVPSTFRHANMMICKDGSFSNEFVSKVCQHLKIGQHLQDFPMDKDEKSPKLDEVLSKWRAFQFTQIAQEIMADLDKLPKSAVTGTGATTKRSSIKAILCSKNVSTRAIINTFNASTTASAIKVDDSQKSVHVVILNAQSEEDTAAMLRSLLTRLLPQTRVTLLQQPKTEEQTHRRLNILDEVDMAVALISPQYLLSPKLVDELHIMLFRQRSNPQRCLFFPIIMYGLPEEPLYFRILNCRYACHDEFWDKLYEKSQLKVLIESIFGRLDIRKQMVLVCAAIHIIRLLNGKDQGNFGILLNLNKINDEIEDIEVIDKLKKL
ncbi:uncharacterized protein TRIADDRAFT_57729 [Trichoplax adhaerens]|uniref:TIR domain-containing protein n=1 Tax=Trichoplax adhaerens TaxID=10228 RepID=B3S091_TRIAD|nr:hypothetical protein TRIADDRAFT_57729 [Trichoplax adhaerens]EDV23968.1 hypothetical protein TRIADDRAFT_57729 [Trichoplax adhaerens]|eukprot:XP_002113494.1 hypothetical protein TRIADDRAFT_57729 [Trichoplax adhaerens]